MKKIALLILLTVAMAFASDPKGKITADTVILKPTSEQLSKAVDLKNTICPITKAKIGEMGSGVSVIYKGQIIHLCCSGCPSSFAKDPEKYLKMVKDDLASKKR